MILNAKEIRERVEKYSLIRNFIDFEKQLTPNGFDLTVEKVFEFQGSGSIDFSNENRVISETREVIWENNWIQLKQGFYKIRTNEIIKMPLNLVAIALPRSSLSRSGVAIDAGVWDAGFEGKSEFLLIVGNKNGFKIKKDARIVQLIFFKMRKIKNGYDGAYGLIT